MNFVKEYAISVITASILSVLLESLLPEGSHKKYVRVVIGLLVMLVILQPLTALPHYKTMFALPDTHLNDAASREAAPRPYVAQSFEKKLALHMEDGIYTAFCKAVDCRVRCSVNEYGQITAVSAVHVQPFSDEIKSYIARNYGLEEAIIQP